MDDEGGNYLMLVMPSPHADSKRPRAKPVMWRRKPGETLVEMRDRYYDGKAPPLRSGETVTVFGLTGEQTSWKVDVTREWQK